MRKMKHKATTQQDSNLDIYLAYMFFLPQRSASQY